MWTADRHISFLSTPVSEDVSTSRQFVCARSSPWCGRPSLRACKTSASAWAKQRRHCPFCGCLATVSSRHGCVSTRDEADVDESLLHVVHRTEQRVAESEIVLGNAGDQRPRRRAKHQGWVLSPLSVPFCGRHPPAWPCANVCAICDRHAFYGWVLLWCGGMGRQETDGTAHNVTSASGDKRISKILRIPLAIASIQKWLSEEPELRRFGIDQNAKQSSYCHIKAMYTTAGALVASYNDTYESKQYRNREDGLMMPPGIEADNLRQWLEAIWNAGESFTVRDRHVHPPPGYVPPPEAKRTKT